MALILKDSNDAILGVFSDYWIIENSLKISFSEKKDVSVEVGGIFAYVKHSEGESCYTIEHTSIISEPQHL
jgi:hypothetical protein